jgi:hypothetical protein
MELTLVRIEDIPAIMGATQLGDEIAAGLLQLERRALHAPGFSVLSASRKRFGSVVISRLAFAETARNRPTGG